MRNILSILLLLGLTSCASMNVNVLGVDVTKLHEVEAEDVGMAVLGAVASVGTHIAGHFIAAELFNVDIELVGLREHIDYSNNPSEQGLLWMARGGFVFQLAVNTALVHLAPDSYFTKGFTGFTSVELLTYDLRVSDGGDFNLIDRYGGEAVLERGLFMLWSGYNFYQLSKEKDS